MNDTKRYTNYNPKDKRTCSGCYKQLETQDGILGFYSFHCPACHRFYKYTDNAKTIILWGLLFFFFAWLFRFFSRVAKKNPSDESSDEQYKLREKSLQID